MPDSLPVDEVLDELGAALDRSGAVVLVAEPGAGKTTRVPPWLARRHRGRGRILVLEPRRIAARAAASRMAEEAREEVGERFGYQVRGEQRRGPRTEVLVVTEALLTRFVQSDPALTGVAAVVIDEFHERSVHADLALALVAEARQALRDDLELVVMSATLDAEPIAAFLGGAPIVRVAGRTFPIEIEYRPPPDLRTPLAESARAAIGEARREGARGVLVFLPGMGEIRRLERDLAERGYRPGRDLFALHGELPLEEQRRALRPTGEPRVILATNVAESALTVPDVDAVVDSGYLRRARHEPDLGFDRLEIERISKASAAQRAGRAGRTGPGRCYRLYSARDHAAFLDHEPAEIGRVDLAELRLLLLDWGVQDAAGFGWFEAPPRAALDAADELLVVLGLAERREGGVAATDRGRRLAALPVHPRLAVLVHEARRRGVGEEGARVAALLADRDLRPRTDAAGAARGEPRRPPRSSGRA
ncbi:MAG: helicase-related protein [Planctomycetota bacterium]